MYSAVLIQAITLCINGSETVVSYSNQPVKEVFD